MNEKPQSGINIDTPEGESPEQDWIRRDFDSYKLWYNSRYPYEAIIRCYDRGNLVGKLAFLEDADLPMHNHYSREIPLIHYPLHRFQDILALLQQEHPVHFLYNTLNHTGHIVVEAVRPATDKD